MANPEWRTDRRSFLTTLRAHFVYMSDSDEDELHVRALQVQLGGVEAVFRGAAAPGDVADLALRTCMCGARIDGFDEYAIHLEAVFSDGS